MGQKVGENDQLQDYALNDQLETGSESSDSGIGSPKFGDIQQQGLADCTHALPHDAQTPCSRIEKILQTIKKKIKIVTI